MGLDFSKLSDRERAEALQIAEELERRRRGGRHQVTDSPYIPHKPHPKQAEFLALTCKEALYGGGTGGGKSDALLMAALQYVHVPGYAAMLFRKTFTDLNLPDALIPRSHEWLSGTDAKWSEQRHEWTFPSGATLTFGFMDGPLDMYKYQGSQCQFVGYDELTQFTEKQYTYMFSRLRTRVGVDVPLRVRSASNPGGVGHRWVKARFIDEDTKGDAVYVPALLRDNPSLREDYRESLSYLDPITRKQYEDGDWTVIDSDLYVFPRFNRKIHASVMPPANTKENFRCIAFGADPGVRDQYAVAVGGLTWDGHWWILDEFYKTGGSTLTWESEFRRLDEKWKPKRWFVDKRKTSDIIDLRKMGFDAVPNIDIHFESGRGTIVPMLALWQNIMAEGKFHVAPHCVNAVKEIENYVYREVEDRNAGDVPVDYANHLNDSIRYLIASVTEGGVPGVAKQWRKGAAPKIEKKPGTPIKIPSMNDFLRHQELKQGKMPGTR